MNRNYWHVSDKALNKFIELAVDICQRYGIKKLVKGENLTWHSMFANTTCPGPYLMSKMDWIAATVNGRLGQVAPSPEPTPQPEGTYTVVKGDTLSDIAKRYGMKLSELTALNPQIGNPNFIRVGQKIVMGSAAPAPAVQYLPIPDYDDESIVDALKAIKVDSSFAYRKKLAAANGIKPFSGTLAQNTRMLALLKSGKLIKA